VFVPDRGCDSQDEGSDELIDWRDQAIDMADVLLFWWPEAADLYLLSTMLAARKDSQRWVCGTPSSLPHSDHLRKYANRHEISAASSLEGIVTQALDLIGYGASRVAGEREVPLHVWQTDSFQRWYSAQTAAGNKLLGARLVWTFNTGPYKQLLLYWALHVRVYVRAEHRVKSNEVVVSRPDISVLALYQRGATADDTTIVLVREFRSPASTPDGLVHELPGGSGSANTAAADQAVMEAEEETGLAIDVRRVRSYGSRQLAATVSAHHAHLFAAEITDEELTRLHDTQSKLHGADDAEQTWTEITTFGELRRNRIVDWATLGMIAEIVLDIIARLP
jgi:ADP-ribose pyrophosphatase YjhB (NUDIX family)